MERSPSAHDDMCMRIASFGTKTHRDSALALLEKKGIALEQSRDAYSSQH